MIDSHCHPNFPQYDLDRDELIIRTLKEGGGMIAVGTNLATSSEVVALAEKYEKIWASVGTHPTDLSSEGAVDNFLQFMSHNKVVAVGEVGLDYYRTEDQKEKARQKEVFKQFIQLAQDFNKPLILHCRCSPRTTDAYSDALEILDGVARPPKFSKENLGVVHSFTGDYSTAQGFIKRGFLIGLNGITTFSGQHEELISQLPLDKILLETDSPYLAPIPHRGERNEPLWLKYVAEKISQVKNITTEQVVAASDQNCQKLFRI